MRAPYAELDWAHFREGETPRCCCAWMALCAIGKNPLASGAPYAELDWSPVGSCEFHSSKSLPFGWLNQHPSLVQALSNLHGLAMYYHTSFIGISRIVGIRTDIAMLGTKLNAQVTIKNLQNMHAKSLPPTGARARLELEYQDWARLQGRGPHTGGPKDRLVGWRMW
jgi:hypothetical protein